MRHTLLIAALVLLPATIRAQQFSPAWKAVAPPNDIALTLTVAAKYSRLQPIDVHYRITNVSNGPLYVPRDFAATACLDIGPPHIWAGLEDSAGKHYTSGYGASCAYGIEAPKPSLTDRMLRGSQRLLPGEHVDGIFRLDPAMFHLPAGPYRLEAVVRGWNDLKQTDWTELSKLGTPFLTGEVPATVRITLTP